MADDKFNIKLRVNVLGYWFDEETKKAYCIVEYIDIKPTQKHTNVYLIESKYIGK